MNIMGRISKQRITSLLAEAGITVNGPDSSDLQVPDDRFYERVITGGSLAIGEMYMQKWWDAERLDLFFEKVFRSGIENRIGRSHTFVKSLFKHRILNPQSRKRAFTIGKYHYDRGIELFSGMLDKRMVYSCAYWKETDSLDQAQEQKLDMICRKLELEPGMTFLDIGCGWGSLVKFAAEKYGVKATGITVSEQQMEFANNRCVGLPVTVRLQDYRDLSGKFDRIASVGMAEHVGAANYLKFLEIASRCLKEDGLFLLHTIGSHISVYSTDPWIEKYIFPNSMLPSLNQLSSAAESFFRIEDLHSFGHDYDRTLMAWHENFTRSWSQIRHLYDDQFFRMWTYYLLTSAASFRTRRLQLWQLLLAKHTRLKPVIYIR